MISNHFKHPETYLGFLLVKVIVDGGVYVMHGSICTLIQAECKMEGPIVLTFQTVLVSCLGFSTQSNCGL